MDHLVVVTFDMRDADDIDAAWAASIAAHDQFLTTARAALHPPGHR